MTLLKSTNLFRFIDYLFLRVVKCYLHSLIISPSISLLEIGEAEKDRW